MSRQSVLQRHGQARTWLFSVMFPVVLCTPSQGGPEPECVAMATGSVGEPLNITQEFTSVLLLPAPLILSVNRKQPLRDATWT